LSKSVEIAERIAIRLKARGETIGVAESSSGGLISAALLTVAGASAYYRGGAVVYTPKARAQMMDIPKEALEGMRSASEPYAALLAATVRSNMAADWGISETGASGPTGNPYGDACVAVSGPISFVRTIETASSDRAQNMEIFTCEALLLLEEALISLD
jgi:nicotinamide-nucleotide amidase